MSIEELDRDIRNAMQTLALAAQGAFSTVTTMGEMPNVRRLTMQRMFAAVEAATKAMREATTRFALAIGPGPGSYEGVSAELQVAHNRMRNVVEQIRQQVFYAIRTGVADKAGALLKGSHGGVGALVGQRAGVLQLVARDSSGRKWNEPSALASAIAKDFAVQAVVLTQIEDLKAAGHTLAYIGQRAVPLADVEAQRRQLFHPNSKEFLRADL